jgi:hypothetical protein
MSTVMWEILKLSSIERQNLCRLTALSGLVAQCWWKAPSTERHGRLSSTMQELLSPVQLHVSTEFGIIQGLFGREFRLVRAQST